MITITQDQKLLTTGSAPSKHGQTHSKPRAQPFRWGRRPSPKSSSLGAWQLNIRACNTLKYLRCSKPKPAKSFHLQCLANDSAQPQKTLKPRWSTPQSLKRDSYPQKTPTKTRSSTDGPAALPGQVTGKSGDPTFRAAKHKQFWLRQDGTPQLQFCLTAALQRRACSCFGQAPARSARRCPKLLENYDVALMCRLVSPPHRHQDAPGLAENLLPTPPPAPTSCRG